MRIPELFQVWNGMTGRYIERPYYVNINTLTLEWNVRLMLDILFHRIRDICIDSQYLDI